MKKIEREIIRNYLIYKTGNKKRGKTYEFQNFKTIRSFGREVYSGFIKLNDAFEEQMNLKNEIDHFNKYTKAKNRNKKEVKVRIHEKGDRLLKERQKVLNDFKIKIFFIRKKIQGK